MQRLPALGAATGQLLGEREIVAREQGHLEALRWAHELEDELVWAIEDCRDLSHHLEHSSPLASTLSRSPGRIDPATRAYLARKEAEGKSRIEAIRCLKRHLARRYYRLLGEPRSAGSMGM